MRTKNLKKTSAKIPKSVPINKNSKYNLNDFSQKVFFGLFLTIMAFSLIAIFFEFLIFDKVYLFKDIGSDTITGFWPFFTNHIKLIFSELIPKWSFNSGMGGNTYQLINIGEPFNLLLLIGIGIMPYMFVIVEVLKFFVIGLLFYKLLDLNLESGYVALFGGLTFALSGYLIIGSGWYMFTSDAFLFVLLLFSLELYNKKGKWSLIPVPFLFAATFQPFYLYLLTIITIIYLIIIFSKKDGFSFKEFFLTLIKVGGLALLGVGIGGFIFFGNLNVLLNSPRVGGQASYSAILTSLPIFAFGDLSHNCTAVLRLFSNDILGNGIYFQGWQNYLEAPAFYCGILVLLLVPQFFVLIKGRVRFVLGAILGIYILGVIFPYIRHSFWLFAGDYYRTYSLHLIFLLVFCAANSLAFLSKKRTKPNFSILISTVLALFLLLFFLPIPPNVSVNSTLQYRIAFMIILYAILLFFMQFDKYKFFIQIILIILTVSELIYFDRISLNDRKVVSSEELTQKIGYNDYTVDAVEYLKMKDNTFYRIEKDYTSGLAIHGSMNDGMMQDYYGTSSYNSFNQKYYIRFLGGVKVLDPQNEAQTRWAQGLRGRPILFSVMNGKYFFSKNPQLDLTPYGFDSIAQFSDVKVLGNRYFLPFGYSYSSYISKSEFEKLSTSQMDIILLRSFVAEDEDLAKFDGLIGLTAKDTTREISYVEIDSITNLKRKESLAISHFGQSKISGIIKLESKKMIFFSIPYDKGWTAKVNGEEKKPELVNLGFMGLVLDKGVYNIELEYNPPYMIHGILLSLVSVCIFIGLVFWDVRKKKNIQITP